MHCRVVLSLFVSMCVWFWPCVRGSVRVILLVLFYHHHHNNLCVRVYPLYYTHIFFLMLFIFCKCNNCMCYVSCAFVVVFMCIWIENRVYRNCILVSFYFLSHSCTLYNNVVW